MTCYGGVTLNSRPLRKSHAPFMCTLYLFLISVLSSAELLSVNFSCISVARLYFIIFCFSHHTLGVSTHIIPVDWSPIIIQSTITSLSLSSLWNQIHRSLTTHFYNFLMDMNHVFYGTMIYVSAYILCIVLFMLYVVYIFFVC